MNLTSNPDGTVSLSIEETNKLRISLGLKPLVLDKAPTTQIPLQLEDNVKTKIQKLKEQRRARELSRTRTLGESSEEEEEDTVKWIEKQRSSKPVIPLKNVKTQLNTPTDILLSHEMEEIDSEPVILTLKDTNVLMDQPDELENVKLRKPEQDSYGYNVYEAMENPEMEILSHYDKKIENKKRVRIEYESKPLETLPTFEKQDKNQVEPVIKKKRKPIQLITQESSESKDHGHRNHASSMDFLESRQKGYEKALEKAKSKSTKLAPMSVIELAKQIQEDDDNHQGNGIIMNPTLEFVKTIKNETKPILQSRPIQEASIPEAIPVSHTRLDLMQDQPLVSNGIGATLEFLALQDDKQEEIPFTLDKKDRFGRVMGPKKAFKEMSHRFHGNKPGKNKLDKEYGKFKEEQKRKQREANYDANVLKTEDALKKSGKAYFELK